MLLALCVGPGWAQPQPQQWTTNNLSVISQVSGSQVRVTPRLPPGPLADVLAQPRMQHPRGEGGLLLDQLLKGPHMSKGPSDLEFTQKRELPWRAGAKAIAKSLPLLSTALAIQELLEDLRCTEGFGGAAACDMGAPETERTVTEYSVSGWNTWRFTRLEACNAVGPQIASQHGGSFLSCEVGGESGAQVRVGFTAYCAGHPNPGPQNCSGWSTWRNVQTRATTDEFCPDLDGVPGSPLPVLPPEAPCPTPQASWPSVPDQVVENRVDSFGDRGKAPLIWPELLSRGIEVEHDAPTYDGPETSPGEREIETHPDGVTVRDTDYEIEYTPDGFRWREVVTTREYPDVESIPPRGDPSESPPTGSIIRPGGQGEVITCGLPGRPPCKIDETGTPEPDQINEQDDVEEAARPILDAIADIGDYVFPDIAWTFALPTGCGPIPVPGFGDWFGEGIDICPFQPTFHAIMSVVWILGGLFGSIGLFWRDQLAGT